METALRVKKRWHMADRAEMTSIDNPMRRPNSGSDANEEAGFELPVVVSSSSPKSPQPTNKWQLASPSRNNDNSGGPQQSRRTSSRVQRGLHSLKRALSGLNIGGDSGGKTPDDARGELEEDTVDVFCFKDIQGVRAYGKVMAALFAALCLFSLILGIILDFAFFEQCIFYTWAILLWCGLFPTALLAARYAVLIKYKGSRRAEEVSDFAFFFIFFVVLHVGAADMLDINYQFTLRSADPSFLLSSRLRDMVVDEEFLAADSHIYKSLDDVGSVEEFWQWLEGPFVANMIQCENDATPAAGGFTAAQGLPCEVADGRMSHVDKVRISTHRVKKKACRYAIQNMQDPDLRGCLGEFSAEAMDTSLWQLGPVADPECQIFLGLETQDPKNSSLSYTNGTYRNYRQDWKAGAESHGSLRSYPPGGYMYTIGHRFGENPLEVYLPGKYNPWHKNFSRTDESDGGTARKQKILQCLREANFVDRRTRMVMVEAAIFAPNINKFVLFQVVFEFTSAGRITSRIMQYMGRSPTVSCAMEYISKPAGWPHGACLDNPICKAGQENHMYIVEPLKIGQKNGLCGRGGEEPAEPGPGADAIDWEAYEINHGNYESSKTWNETRWRFSTSLPYVTRNYHNTLALLGFCVYFLVVELEELMESGLLEYAKQFWNVWDLLVVAFFVTAFVFDTLQKLATPLQGVENVYAEWVPAVSYYQTAKQLIATTTLFAWCKWLKCASCSS